MKNQAENKAQINFQTSRDGTLTNIIIQSDAVLNHDEMKQILFSVLAHLKDHETLKEKPTLQPEV